MFNNYYAKMSVQKTMTGMKTVTQKEHDDYAWFNFTYSGACVIA